MSHIKYRKKEQFLHPDYLRISLLTKQAMIERVEHGGIPGIAPRGYGNIPDSGGKVKLHAVEAPHIFTVFKQAAKGRSLRAMAEFLFQHGITSRNGRPLSPATISHMLHNRFYIGEVYLDGTWYPGNHQPLISRELFTCVQERLTIKV